MSIRWPTSTSKNSPPMRACSAYPPIPHLKTCSHWLAWTSSAASIPPCARSRKRESCAERSIFYLQRMPTLLDLQVERLAYEMAVQPEAKALLADLGRASLVGSASDRLVESLPDLLRANPTRSSRRSCRSWSKAARASQPPPGASRHARSGNRDGGSPAGHDRNARSFDEQIPGRATCECESRDRTNERARLHRAAARSRTPPPSSSMRSRKVSITRFHKRASRWSRPRAVCEACWTRGRSGKC